MPAKRPSSLLALPLLLLAASPVAAQDMVQRPGNPMADLPPGFDQMSTAEQLKLLQSRLAVLGVLQQVTDTQKSIAAAIRDVAGPPPASRAGPAAAPPPPVPSPVVVQNSAAPPPALPTVQRIYLRDGVRMADLQLPNHGGIRAVRAGSQIGSELRVSEITPDDVVVTMAAERVSLSGSGGPGVNPAQPVVPPPPQAQAAPGTEPAIATSGRVPPGAIAGRPPIPLTETPENGR